MPGCRRGIADLLATLQHERIQKISRSECHDPDCRQNIQQASCIYGNEVERISVCLFRQVLAGLVPKGVLGAPAAGELCAAKIQSLPRVAVNHDRKSSAIRIQAFHDVTLFAAGLMGFACVQQESAPSCEHNVHVFTFLVYEPQLLLPNQHIGGGLKIARTNHFCPLQFFFKLQ